MNRLSIGQMNRMLGYVLARNPEDVREMLRRHGAKNTESLKGKALTMAMLMAIRDNAKFRDDFRDYLTGMILHEAPNSSFVRQAAAETFGFVSQPGQYYNNVDDKPGGTFWQNLGTSENINSVLNTGLNVLSTSLINKSNKESEERALQAKALDLQIAQTNAAAAMAKAQNPESKGMSALAWVGITLGVIGAGVLIYMAVKRKK